MTQHVDFRPLRLPEESDLLIAWLSSDTWPFHQYPQPDEQMVSNWISDGAFEEPENKTFWITLENTNVGLLRVFELGDIDDGYPRFDLRIAEQKRGQGLGKTAVRWMIQYLFQRYPSLQRIEASTRQDNIGMRRVLRSCGFAKEAHFRKAWPSEGLLFDAVYYGILRDDWETGHLSPVKFNDE